MFTRRAKRFCAVDRGDHGVDRRGRAGDHGLARRDVAGDARHLGSRRSDASVASASSSSSATAPCPASCDISRDRWAMTRSPSATRQRAGHHGGGDLAHRVADHRVGSARRRSATARSGPAAGPSAPAGPRRRRPPVRPRRGPSRSEKPTCFDEDRLQRRRSPAANARFVGQQLPAHARPLRALAGVHEHRARPRRRPRAARRRRRRDGPSASARSPATAGRVSRAQTVANRRGAGRGGG